MRSLFRVVSTFSRTEHLDQSLLYPVSEHSPQPVSRVSVSKKGGVDVIPTLLNISDILGTLYHQTVRL